MSHPVQKWEMRDGETIHRVECLCEGLTKNLTVTIDGESFVLKNQLFHSPERKEIFRVGDEAYLLVVDKSGHAEIFLGEDKIEEV